SCGGFHRATALQGNDSVGSVEVPVVVTDDHDRLSAAFQVRKDVSIEKIPEDDILFGRPFVEDVDGAVAEKSHGQGERLPLPAGERSRELDSALLGEDLHRALEIEAFDVAPHSLDVSGRRRTPWKDERVGEHGGDVLHEPITATFVDNLAVHLQAAP